MIWPADQGHREKKGKVKRINRGDMATVTFFPKSILQEKESLYLGTHEHLEGEGVGSLIILKDEKKTK